MKKILVIFLVLITGNVISENTIIAIVNDIPIPLNSIETYFLNTNSNEEKIEILNTQIDLVLQLQKVSEFNLKPTIEDVELVLKDVAKKNNLSISALLNLEEINSIKDEIEEKLSILNLQRFVTRELKKPTKKILNECSNIFLEPDQKQIKIAQIIVSEIDSDTNNTEQKNTLIKNFLSKLANHISKGASFEAFAKLHSQHPSYRDGGVTDWLKVNNPTLKMLDSLGENEVSEIYSTAFGLAIAIKIEERFISSKLEDCEDRIIYENAEIYYSEWLESLRGESFIKIYYDKL